MFKLFRIDYMDDCDDATCLMIAKNESEVKQKFEKEIFDKLSCPMTYFVFEINEIDGHKILVE